MSGGAVVLAVVKDVVEVAVVVVVKVDLLAAGRIALRGGVSSSSGPSPSDSSSDDDQLGFFRSPLPLPLASRSRGRGRAGRTKLDCATGTGLIFPPSGLVGRCDCPNPEPEPEPGPGPGPVAGAVAVASAGAGPGWNGETVEESLTGDLKCSVVWSSEAEFVESVVDSRGSVGREGKSEGEGKAALAAFAALAAASRALSVSLGRSRSRSSIGEVAGESSPLYSGMSNSGLDDETRRSDESVRARMDAAIRAGSNPSSSVD